MSYSKDLYMEELEKELLEEEEELLYNLVQQYG
jgi:hypothetical protein